MGLKNHEEFTWICFDVISWYLHVETLQTIKDTAEYRYFIFLIIFTNNYVALTKQFSRQWIMNTLSFKSYVAVFILHITAMHRYIQVTVDNNQCNDMIQTHIMYVQSHNGQSEGHRSQYETMFVHADQ
jgi:hypothetical protein